MVEKLVQDSGMFEDLLEHIISILDGFKEKLKWDGLFIQKSIDQLLFGYTDPLLSLLKEVPFVKEKVPTDRFNFSVSHDPAFVHYSHIDCCINLSSLFLSFLAFLSSIPSLFRSSSPSPFLFNLSSFLPSTPSLPLLSPPSSSLLLSQSRESIQGPNIVYTGKGNLSRVAQFKEWNGQTNISGWGTSTARMINGTGGFMFHPGVTRDENLTAFISELFR